MDLSIIIPTYNERENIENLTREIFSEFKKNKIKGEVIVVDDNSLDKTYEIVGKLKKNFKNLVLLRRKGKLGLSSAVLDGIEISRSEIVGVMDADFSHPVNKIHLMYEEIKKGNDLVIGSRYVSGGKIFGWNLLRKVLSRGATILSRVFTKVKDPMTGYFLVKKKLVENKSLNPRGFKILLEILVKCQPKKIKEIPIKFINRTKGKSKASFGEIFSLLKNLWGYLFFKNNSFGQFLKFAFVGGIGTIINILFLYLFTDILGIYYLFSAVFSFVIALTNNYLLNKFWTFNEKLKHKFFRKYSQFFVVSILALAVNLLFLYLFTDILGIYYLFSQALAIVLSMGINFFGNKFWTFRPCFNNPYKD